MANSKSPRSGLEEPETAATKRPRSLDVATRLAANHARGEIARAMRIVDAERKAGFRDRVVIGGLSGYVIGLAERLASSDAPVELKQRASLAAELLADYASLEPTARGPRAEEAARALGGQAGRRDGGGQAPALLKGTDGTPPQQTMTNVVEGPRRTHVPERPAGRAVLTSDRPGPLSRTRPNPGLGSIGLNLDTPVSALKGVGAQRARTYARLGLKTVRDLLFHFPTRHVAFPPACPVVELFFKQEGSVVGTLESVAVEPLAGGLKRMRALVRDGSGVVEAIWLRRGQPYLSVRAGETIAISGALALHGSRLTFDNPEYERAQGDPVHTRGLVPVYPLTAGVFDKELRTRIRWVLEHFADQVEEPLPPAVRQRLKLLPRAEALRALHFPAHEAAYDRARERFAFEELFTIQLCVLQRRLAYQESGAVPLPLHEAALEAMRGGLGFALTGAQEHVLHEILDDVALPRPMTRLLQGEVGSGKTAVAALALANTVAQGYQGALMAPTEILAEQHFATLSRMFELSLLPHPLPPPQGGGEVFLLGDEAPQPPPPGIAEETDVPQGRRVVVALLTGSVKGKQRASVYEKVAAGEVDVVVGTQALIQEALDFRQLGLVIVDEQHRFGVKQRVTLRRKGHEKAAQLPRSARDSGHQVSPVSGQETLPGAPHLLVMTATPIPRTLALSLYGDLDLSVIDALPPGRQPVRTVLLTSGERPYAYERIRRAVERGEQAFLICPLVEESDVLQAKAASEEFERLRREDLANVRLGLLHGRMKAAQKDAVMRAFRNRDLDVLVSTAVVEVGVDVPDATVMCIEGAERFGLAQLHQFRGRVGRGSRPAVCILLSELPDPQSSERLRAVEQCSNGLELAEQDLRLRGPGDYFGVRQSGFPALKVARLDDAPLVEAARSAASEVLQQDPDLQKPEHALLASHLAAFKEQSGEPS